MKLFGKDGKIKKVKLVITFYDDSYKDYSLIKDEGKTEFQHYEYFLKWFFRRKDSEEFMFYYKDGFDVFKREDIKRISVYNIT